MQDSTIESGNFCAYAKSVKIISISYPFHFHRKCWTFHGCLSFKSNDANNLRPSYRTFSSGKYHINVSIWLVMIYHFFEIVNIGTQNWNVVIGPPVGIHLLKDHKLHFETRQVEILSIWFQIRHRNRLHGVRLRSWYLSTVLPIDRNATHWSLMNFLYVHWKISPFFTPIGKLQIAHHLQA